MNRKLQFEIPCVWGSAGYSEIVYILQMLTKRNHSRFEIIELFEIKIFFNEKWKFPKIKSCIWD